MSSKRLSSSRDKIKSSDQPKLSDCWSQQKKPRKEVSGQQESGATCPICNQSLWSDNSLNNLHIDSCLRKVGVESKATKSDPCLKDDPIVYGLSIKLVEELPGLYIIPDFITEEEEHCIIQLLDDDCASRMKWKISTFNGMCFSKYWGVKTQFGLPDELRLVRKNDADKGEFNMPDLLLPFIDRLHHLVALNASYMTSELRDFKPNECNANSYFAAEKHYLRPHFDDRTLSGPILTNLSLGGEARMTYAKPVNAALATSAIAAGAFAHTVSVPPPMLALLRYKYTLRASARKGLFIRVCSNGMCVVVVGV